MFVYIDQNIIKKKNKHLVNFAQTGRRMLNTCLPRLSCGARLPIWTDEDAPDEVLSPATVNVYASSYRHGYPQSECKNFTFNTYQVQVMRCSLDTDYDLIYRYIGDYYDECARAFCGMN